MRSLFLFLIACGNTGTPDSTDPIEPTDVPEPECPGGDQAPPAETPLPACESDDADEPNNSIATAIPRTEGSDLIICPSNEDYWELEVGAGQTITITVNADVNHDGDIDIVLYDRCGNGLISSVRLGNTEQVVWTNDGATLAVLLKVELFEPGTPPFITYDFSSSLE